MYSGMLSHVPFRPDESSFQHAREREEYVRRLKENLPLPEKEEGNEELSLVPSEKKDLYKAESLGQLLEMISPEDSALVALVVFLLCDNSENDVVLLGILLYVLLSK